MATAAGSTVVDTAVAFDPGLVGAVGAGIRMAAVGRGARRGADRLVYHKRWAHTRNDGMRKSGGTYR